MKTSRIDGKGGQILVTNTASVKGNFKSIYVLTDAVFSKITSDTMLNGEDTYAQAADFGTVTKGTVLNGMFTEVQLTSGKVILYK